MFTCVVDLLNFTECASCLLPSKLPLHNECIPHARHASQNRFYFGNLIFVFCCHIFGYNKKDKEGERERERERETVTCHMLQIDTQFKRYMYLNHMNDPVRPEIPSVKASIKEIWKGKMRKIKKHLQKICPLFFRLLKWYDHMSGQQSLLACSSLKTLQSR